MFEILLMKSFIIMWRTNSSFVTKLTFSLGLLTAISSIFDTALSDTPQPEYSEFTKVNSTLCPLNPCQRWFTFNFTCSHSGCTEIPIKDIPIDVEELYLSGNQISIINDSLIYKSLRYLDISQNNISVISHGAFGDLSKITRINLAGNKLTRNSMALDSNVFARLSNLEEIDLSDNLFETLYDNMLSMNPQASPMLRINISHNLIYAMSPNAVNDFNSLTVLDLSHNLFQSFHVLQFRGLNNIRHINAAYNQLTDLPKVDSLQTLERLSLSDNKITSFNASVFKETIGSNSNLKVLDLSRNRLTTIEYGTLPLIGLTELYLDGNAQIVEIPDGAFNISTQLSLISITECPSLKHVGRGVVNSYAQSVRVNISRNYKLSSIDPEAFHVVRNTVVNLDLSWNDLVTLPENLLDWRRLARVDLSGNRWDCDCHMLWIKDVVKNGSNVTRTLAQTIL